MTETFYHYVYRITNLVENKHYYGKRTSTILPELDLGKMYFSSKKNVSGKNFKKDQKANPSNYKYKIVAKFKTKEEALKREVRLHKKFDVKNHSKFYNAANQTSSKFTTNQQKGDVIFIYNIETQKRKHHPVDLDIPDNWVRGTPQKDKDKIGKAQIGRVDSEETKRKRGQSNKGKIRSKEACEKYKENNKGKVWVHDEKGDNYQFYKDEIPEGYILGINRSEKAEESLKSKTGKIFYHNKDGKNKLFYQGENTKDYTIGMAIDEKWRNFKTTSQVGRVWVKNTSLQICKLVQPDDIPEGYELGRLIKNGK